MLSYDLDNESLITSCSFDYLDLKQLPLRKSSQSFQDGGIGLYYILQFRHMQLPPDGKLPYHTPFISGVLAMIDPYGTTKPAHSHPGHYQKIATGKLKLDQLRMMQEG